MILGIHDGHNASACLIDNNNNIRYAISEERFTRKKNQRGFPKYSVNYILNEIKKLDKESTIDIITVGGIFRKGNRLKALKNFQKEVNVPMVYFNHHLCHASLYKLSNFKECLIITMDGGGDALSSTVSIGNKKGLELLAQNDLIDSVGDFYASITEVLGFKPMEDEGKVMSLSSYDCVDESPINLKVIDYDSKRKSFENYLGIVGYEATKALKRIFNLNKNVDFKNKVLISKYAQKTLEDVVLKMINDFSKETGINNIVFSGGVAQNVKLNKKIAENYNLYVPPFMGDEGLSVGSALLFNNKKNKKTKNKEITLKNTYLGYEIKNEDMELLYNNDSNIHKNYKITYVEEEELPETIGNLIVNNKIVCLCRGKMEFGPRALGNRSIISLPTKENSEKINKMLNRDNFMPFAPTILYEHIDDYIINPSYSPFMTLLFDIKHENKNKIDGVVHVDNTTRAQTLKREFNKTYYDIINHVYENTNIPMVLNTSFNLHGEPIVCNEQDALKSFKSVGNALLLGNWLIEKI
ncbi:carbamoyltransferase C-terminal domain-containing protein [Methanothermococcus okinawensis]|uniref:Carbamoyltransferase n=1 Tax=Methanothermococcus okinawensis (strain DSM 14208 / JCM 11175 / IH1) TaxID=647113 RepID=F8AMN2_METOI|nr:carbamoyltransferase C-terminal domain-containing protein [Methanothermococcus okinawensis]AEH06863.1 Carbamoyltransferase [Methanothermococcus okinawensis IH1]